MDPKEQTTAWALTRLEDSLNATNVLSKDYQGTILGWAYKISELAYRAGQEAAARELQAN